MGNSGVTDGTSIPDFDSCITLYFKLGKTLTLFSTCRKPSNNYFSKLWKHKFSRMLAYLRAGSQTDCDRRDTNLPLIFGFYKFVKIPPQWMILKQDVVMQVAACHYLVTIPQTNQEKSFPFSRKMAKYDRDRRDTKNVTDGTHWKCTQFAKNGLLLHKTKLCCQSWFRTSLNIWRQGLYQNQNWLCNLDDVLWLPQSHMCKFVR